MTTLPQLECEDSLQERIADLIDDLSHPAAHLLPSWLWLRITAAEFCISMSRTSGRRRQIKRLIRNGLIAEAQAANATVNPPCQAPSSMGDDREAERR